MNSKDRIELFLKYQSENMSFEDISKILTLVKEKIKKLYNIQLEEEIIILKNNRVL